MKIPSACGPCFFKKAYPTDKDTQTIVFRVFHFFFKKARLLNSFFLMRGTQKNKIARKNAAI